MLSNYLKIALRNLKKHKGTAGKQTRRPVESFLKILICAGGVDLPEKGQEQQDDQRCNGDDAHVEEEIDPICGVGLGGDSHECDGAKLGAEDTYACGPPGDSSAAQEEVFGGLFTPGEIEAHSH